MARRTRPLYGPGPPCFLCRILYGHEGERCLAASARTLYGPFIPVETSTALLVMEGRALGMLDGHPEGR